MLPSSKITSHSVLVISVHCHLLHSLLTGSLQSAEILSRLLKTPFTYLSYMGSGAFYVPFLLFWIPLSVSIQLKWPLATVKSFGFHDVYHCWLVSQLVYFPFWFFSPFLHFLIEKLPKDFSVHFYSERLIWFPFF